MAGRTHKPILDRQKCRVCDLCRLLCPDLAITKSSNKKQINIDYRYCKGCGICTVVCPKDAIEMIPEESVD